MSVLLTTSQVAEKLDVSAETVRQWAESGRLPVASRTKGGHRRFSPEDVQVLARELTADVYNQAASASEALADDRSAASSIRMTSDMSVEQVIAENPHISADLIRRLYPTLVTTARAGDRFMRDPVLRQAVNRASDQFRVFNEGPGRQVLANAANALRVVDSQAILVATAAYDDVIQREFAKLRLPDSILPHMAEPARQLMEAAAKGLATVNFPRLIPESYFESLRKIIDENPAFDTIRMLLQESEEEAEAFVWLQWPIAPSMTKDLIRRVVALRHVNDRSGAESAILEYYRQEDHEALREALAAWPGTLMGADPKRMRILQVALDLHRQGTYTATVPMLLLQVEGIMGDYVGSFRPYQLGEPMNLVKSLVGDPDEREFQEWAVALAAGESLWDLYRTVKFIDQIQKPSHERDPAGHSMRHGFSTAYDTEDLSLKLFLLLDAISYLTRDGPDPNLPQLPRPPRDMVRKNRGRGAAST